MSDCGASVACDVVLDVFSCLARMVWNDRVLVIAMPSEVNEDSVVGLENTN